MSIVLRNPQIIAPFAIVLVAALLCATVIFFSIVHVNVWHAVIASGLVPDGAYHH